MVISFASYGQFEVFTNGFSKLLSDVQVHIVLKNQRFNRELADTLDSDVMQKELRGALFTGLVVKDMDISCQSVMMSKTAVPITIGKLKRGQPWHEDDLKFFVNVKHMCKCAQRVGYTGPFKMFMNAGDNRLRFLSKNDGAHCPLLFNAAEADRQGAQVDDTDNDEDPTTTTAAAKDGIVGALGGEPEANNTTVSLRLMPSTIDIAYEIRCELSALQSIWHNAGADIDLVEIMILVSKTARGAGGWPETTVVFRFPADDGPVFDSKLCGTLQPPTEPNDGPQIVVRSERENVLAGIEDVSTAKPALRDVSLAFRHLYSAKSIRNFLQSCRDKGSNVRLRLGSDGMLCFSSQHGEAAFLLFMVTPKVAEDEEKSLEERMCAELEAQGAGAAAAQDEARKRMYVDLPWFQRRFETQLADEEEEEEEDDASEAEAEPEDREAACAKALHAGRVADDVGDDAQLD